MKLSIILCTKNRYELLKNAIKNCISQSFKDWELIVVEGDSQDDTHNMLVTMYCQGAIEHLPHTGNIVDARNLGLQYAKGEYVVFFDDDDAMVDSRFEIQTKLLDENPSIDVISCSTITDEQFGVGDTFVEHSYKDIKKLVENNAPLDFICFPKSCMFRKSTLDKIFADGEMCKQELKDGCELNVALWRMYFKGAKFMNTIKTMFVYNYKHAHAQHHIVNPAFYNDNIIGKPLEEIKKVVSKIYRKKKK
jgi:glycosyltransferase involved in cell wall biosynthesis